MLNSNFTIYINKECNNNCIFCYKDSLGINKAISAPKIKARLRRGRLKGITSVEFSGGEPTLRNDIPELIRYSKKIGFKEVGILTNGRRFVYQDFCNDIAISGLDYALFSIYSHEEKVHDSITQTEGSLSQTIAGIRNLYSMNRKIILGANIVINKNNYRSLRDTVSFLKNESITLFNLYSVFPKDKLYDGHKIVPLYSETSPFINGLLKEFNEDKSLRIRLYNTPFCFLNYTQYSIPGKLENIFNREVFKKSKIKLKTCIGCKYWLSCGGIYSNYIKIYGTAEFNNRLHKISNGGIKFLYLYAERFDYSSDYPYHDYLVILNSDVKCKDLLDSILDNVEFPECVKIFLEIREMDLKNIKFAYKIDDFLNRLKENNIKFRLLFPLPPCLSKNYSAQIEFENSENLFFIREGFISHYKIGGYIDSRVSRFIRKYGQIFVSAGENWPRELFCARLIKKCEHCEDRKAMLCPGCFKSDIRNVTNTSRFEKLLISELRKLRGNILDVGCGDSPHFDIFKYLVENNMAETYYGIDVNQRFIAKLGRRVPGSLKDKIKVFKIGIEDFSSPPEFFDNVLMIRSYNHIFDLDASLDNIKRVIKKNGKLIVMDNVYFAIINSGKANYSSDKFEEGNGHFRTHSSFEAEEKLIKHGFRIIEHHPVRPGEGCWYLKCKYQIK